MVERITTVNIDREWGDIRCGQNSHRFLQSLSDLASGNRRQLPININKKIVYEFCLVLFAILLACIAWIE